MKSLILLIPLALILIAATFGPDTQRMDLETENDEVVSASANDLFEKALKHYDPQGIWDNFSGNVRLVTTFPAETGNYGEEIIEIRNADEYYKCTNTRRNHIIIQEVENEKCFHQVNGISSLSEEDIETFGLSCENIMYFQQHHSAHIGYLMQLKRSGLDLSEEVTSDEINGQTVDVLSFYPQPGREINPYWDYRIRIFLDSGDNRLRAVRWESDTEQGQTVYLFGELEVNGIRMPQTRVYYNEDGSYFFTDIFTPV